MSNKISKKILALGMSVVAITAVLQGCIKQEVKQPEKNSISSHYSGDGCAEKIKVEEENKVQTYTLYEYTKEAVLAETSLSGKIGDVIEVPENERISPDAYSAMKGISNATITGEAKIKGFAYVDKNGKFKETWKNGTKPEDLETSFNENGDAQLAVLYEQDGKVVGWALVDGLLLVQIQDYFTYDSSAPEGFRYVDFYESKDKHEEKTGLIPGGSYVMRPNNQ